MLERAMLVVELSVTTPSHALTPHPPAAQRFLLPDPSFESTVVPTTNFGRLQTNAIVTQVIEQPDGKVLTAGRSCQTTLIAAPLYQECGPILLIRYSADGALDARFGISGSVTTTITTGTSQLLKVVVMSGGKIMAVGWNCAPVLGSFSCTKSPDHNMFFGHFL